MLCLWLNWGKVETRIFYQTIQQQLTTWPQCVWWLYTVCLILGFFYTITLQHITYMYKHVLCRNFKAYCEKKHTAWVIVTILCKLLGNYISIRQPTFMIARDGDIFIPTLDESRGYIGSSCPFVRSSVRHTFGFRIIINVPLNQFFF